ncbi:hypothetical protein IFR04_003722 [Cadophora malorum]|uniref:Fungal N-terminal domain-containing protein n=1 Tax=Cadophora malorum TaxID=108018 RepID=A0A8H7WE20_9HELO|nr:hypothetical protein IFR04_003722 [Cadophora malorum]
MGSGRSASSAISANSANNGAAALVTAKKVYDSETGFTDKHEKLHSATKGMNELVSRLEVNSPRDSRVETVDENNLDALTARCREGTGDILDLLENMKSKKTRSVKEALKSVTKGAWKSSRMKELQEKLAQVNADLQLQFAVVTRSENLERLECLITSNGRPGKLLGSANSDLETPVDGETFDDSLIQTKRDDIRESTRENFRRWLSKGNGTFQIIAKPGAGKSTMMKFIYESTETDRLLREWSDGRSLIKANFFFWK